MTKPISELTYKVVAYDEVQHTDSDECIDWAIEMMQLGYESPALYMLASFSKPTSYFEVIDYVKNTLAELGLKMKKGNDAVLSYAAYYIHQIAKGLELRTNLTELYGFCQMMSYEDFVYDFYLLYWAWDDLDYEDNVYNYYWEGARRANIEKLVVDEAVKWIEKYKDHYLQQCI